MNILITGASGYAGAVVAERLVTRGHRVTALSRSDASDARITDAGAMPVAGALTDLATVREAAAGVDVVVHAAIDYADPEFGSVEGPALELLAARPIVYLSSTLVYGDTGATPVTEDREPAPLVQPFKLDGERRALASGGVVLRLGLAHGRGGSALVGQMRDGAAEHGVVTYVGSGENRWSVVHVDDLADAVAAAVERLDEVRGAVLNVTSAEAPSLREIAEAVAASCGVNAASVPVEEAAAAMGPFADQLTRDLLADGTRCAERLGWSPSRPGMLGELAAAR